MTISTNDLLNSIMESFDRISHVDVKDIPDIDLYMDQVTTFMDSHMKATTRNPKEDKILTKTMINNYAKNDLLPPPVKKKYSKEHILVLIFIYYFKGVLSISDIQELLNPLTENFFGKEGKIRLEDIYTEVFEMGEERVEFLKEDVKRMYEKAESGFADAKDEEQKFLKRFAFICMLGYDVYVKKLLIEKIIDGMKEENEAAQKAKAEPKKTTKNNKNDKNDKNDKNKKQ